MKIKGKIHREVKWAEGKKKSEFPKYTWWSGSKESARLGGFTITNLCKYENSEVEGSVQCIAHTSNGESYWKNFDIPLDKIDEFCHALREVRDFAVGLKKSEEHLKEHNE